MSSQDCTTVEFDDYYRVRSVDLNGDGQSDILVTGVVGEGDNVFSAAAVFLNKGNGTFVDPVTFGFYDPAQNGSPIRKPRR